MDFTSEFSEAANPWWILAQRAPGLGFSSGSGVLGVQDFRSRRFVFGGPGFQV